MSSDILSHLSSWVTKNASIQKPREYDFDLKRSMRASVQELRSILGNLMKSVNAASSIFKTASRSPSPESAAMVRSILDEVEEYPKIRTTLNQIKPLFIPGGVFEGMMARMILHTIHYVERANFTEEQKARLREMASLDHASASEFPDEINQAGLHNLLRNSIYSNPNTIKVLREVLQNAVDATDPKQHPQLQSRQDFKPEIHIDTDIFHEKVGEQDHYYMDLVIEDKGIGMDWETLSKKFFVTFESGKGGDTGAAGGFGIAKQLIQDAPEHGWAIDTNGVHSSRFNRNVFFGTKRGSSYTAPSSEIRSNKDGTTLSLHGMRYAAEESIKNLCQVYATNGRVKIFFKGEEQKPKFTMDSEEIKSMESIDELPDMLGSSDAEKDSAKRTFSKFKDGINDKIEEVGLMSGGKTKYKFYLKKSVDGASGKLYVMVNGQYQFDKDKLIPKVDIICSIETSARPGDDDYPLDPGRENLRGEISKKIDELISMIIQFSSKVTEDDLFKDGIEMIDVNEDAEPMEVSDSDSTTSKEEMLMYALQHITGSSGFKEKEEEKDPRGREGADGSSETGSSTSDPNSTSSSDQGNSQSGSSSDGSTTPGTTEDKVDQVVKNLIDIAGSNNVFSQGTIKNMVTDAMASKDPVEQNKKIKAIIEGLSTPAQILIQKNFVARAAIQDNSEILGPIMVVWQKAMKLIMQKVASTAKYSFSRGRKFVPGVIFSDEVLGLYMPAKKDTARKHDSVSVNPVTVAAFLLPKDFSEKIAERDGEKEAFEMAGDLESDKSSSDTPINRVSKFIFHLAVHEMCHLIHPDFSDTGSEQFHQNISKMELICHDVYEEIKKEIKEKMPELRKSAKKLITIVARHKASTVKAESFRRWSEGKISFAPMSLPKISVDRSSPRSRTFRDFLRESREEA
jgi:hypothetical protein